PRDALVVGMVSRGQEASGPAEGRHVDLLLDDSRQGAAGFRGETEGGGCARERSQTGRTLPRHADVALRAVDRGLRPADREPETSHELEGSSRARRHAHRAEDRRALLLAARRVDLGGGRRPEADPRLDLQPREEDMRLLSRDTWQRKVDEKEYTCSSVVVQ